MSLRPSTLFIGLVGAGIITIGLMFTDAFISRQIDSSALAERAGIVKALALTDLCLFTEARYTRNPSLTDLHTAFQDHPLALEHFPSGSVVTVPPHLESLRSGK